jgi:NhaP-type Na+/H+ or K+/H+ antiporter
LPERYLIGLAAIFLIGMLARWIAWRLHLPSILLLLIAGIIVGPLSGFLNPDELFGNLLAPLVSISVGVILFEGGLSLRVADLRQIGGAVRNLVTVGVAITWLLASGAAWLVVGLDIRLAVLLGAILVVTGPTVVIPLLNHVRPTGQISNIIRWEGILNDPIGALLAVLVFEAILAGSFTGHADTAAVQFLVSILTGVLVGAAAAGLLMLLLKYYLLPDFLQNPFSLTIVIGAFTAANALEPESGFLATTVMGIVLANQKIIPVRHIVEFKENLRVLVISSLFIILAARLRVESLNAIGWTSWIFLALLILVARPAAVWASTVGSDLKPREKAFLAWMAPRGIVAAAVSSIFAERLIEAGYSEAERLGPLTFLVIIGTVAIYGLSAFPIAKRLGLAEPSPQGVLFVGAHSWAREMAAVLTNEGFQVALADSNWDNVSKSRMAGLPTYFGGILSEEVLDQIDLYGIGRLMAMTSNDEANSLATLHFGGIFGRSKVYQLPPEAGLEATRKLVSPRYLSGRFLFGERITYDYLAARFRAGGMLKKSNLTEQFGMDAFRTRYGESAVPLFIVGKNKSLSVVTAEWEAKPRPGDSVIALIDALPEKGSP